MAVVWMLIACATGHLLSSASAQLMTSTYFTASTAGGSQCEEARCSSLRCFVHKAGEHGQSPSCIKRGLLQYTSPPVTVDTCDAVATSGVYQMQHMGETLRMYCQVDGTGKWTVIQRRVDGSTDFYRPWASYKAGFGDVTQEFWLGNDNIHQLTSSLGLTKLRVDLEDQTGEKHTVYYTVFVLGDEADKYKLTVSGYTGSTPPGDSLVQHNGKYFSTSDADNDSKNNVHCAQISHGAWWYHVCQQSNLNGDYGNDNYGQGIGWASWKGQAYSMKSASMMIKAP